MNKTKSIPKLNRTPSHRKAMLRNMATSLLEHERIITTRVKGKALRRYLEPLITLARKNFPAKNEKTKAKALHSRRILLASLRNEDIAKKLIEDIAPRYKDRPGGYLRIIHLPERKSDASKMSIVELVERREKVKHIKQAGSKAAAQKDKKTQAADADAVPEKSSQKSKDRWYNRLGRKAGVGDWD